MIFWSFFIDMDFGYGKNDDRKGKKGEVHCQKLKKDE